MHCDAMDKYMYRLLRKRLCTDPQRCQAACMCHTVGEFLNNTDALWCPYSAPLLHRDISVAQSIASYRNKHTQEHCGITVETLHEVAADQDHASLINEIRTRKQRGAGKDNHVVTMRDLLPIAQPLTLRDTIPKDYWDKDSSFVDVMPLLLHLVDGYERWPVDAAAVFYEQHVCDSVNDVVDPAGYGLPLFYSKTNPLGIVLQLLEMDPAPQNNPAYIVMEYIFSVCMMYYTMCNGRWMVKKTDPTVPFTERNGEYIVALFPSYDFVDKVPSPINTCEEEVTRGGLSHFVSSVLHHLHTHNPLFRKHIDTGLITKFLGTKLVGNNFMQTIETLHWAALPVHGLHDNVVTSKRSAGDITPRVSVARWEGATGYKNCNLEVYKTDTAVARIPAFFSHSFFNPYTPCVRLPGELTDAWNEQGERSIDVLVLAMTWLKACGAALPQEPAPKKAKTSAAYKDSVNAKTEKAKEMVARYYDGYEEQVSEKSRNWYVSPDMDNQDRVNEVDVVVSRVRHVIVQLSMCCQKKCSSTFMMAVQHRFATLQLLGVSYDKTAGWNNEQPHMWPALPRYRHPHVVYMENGAKYAYARLYLPQLCQPGWQQQPTSNAFPFDWYMPVNGVMGMSPSGLKWCIRRGAGINKDKAFEQGWAHFSQNRYNIVEHELIARYDKEKGECNPYVAWSALELLLRDEVSAAHAMWCHLYDDAPITDDRIHEMIDTLVDAHHTYVQEDVLEPCNKHQHNVYRFFTSLFTRYTYNEAVIPTREELSVLLSEDALRGIVEDMFKSESPTAVKGGEDILLEESYRMICQGVNPADEVGQQDDSWVVDDGGRKVNLNAFYNWLQSMAFSRYIYPALRVWYTCMAPDGITMHDGHGWTSHLVTFDVFSMLIQQSKCITDMYLNKQTQSLIRGLVQHVMQPDSNPLPAALQMFLCVTTVVLQDKSELTKDLPPELKKVLMGYKDAVVQRKADVKALLLKSPFSPVNITTTWEELERLGVPDPCTKIASWQQKYGTDNKNALSGFLRHNHTDLRIKGIARTLGDALRSL